MNHRIQNVIVKSLVIDSQSSIKQEKSYFPGSLSPVLSFSKIFLSKQKMNPKFTLWNTNKAGGWEIYKDLTENNQKFNEVDRDY